MKTKTEEITENVIELFESFNNLLADKRQDALKSYDAMLASRLPDNAEFFAKLRGYLVELTV